MPRQTFTKRRGYYTRYGAKYYHGRSATAWNRKNFRYAPRKYGFAPGRPETKTINNRVNYQQMTDNLGNALSILTSDRGDGCMNAVVQGSAQDQRLGKKFTVTGIYARFSAFVDKEDVTAIGHTESIRIMIFVDNANNSVDKSTAAGLITASTGFEQPLTHRDMDNTSRYKVLYDKWVPLTGTTQQHDVNKWSLHKDAFIEVALPKLNVPVHMSSATGTTGASVQSGAIYVACISSDAASANSQIHGTVRLHFKE